MKTLTVIGIFVGEKTPTKAQIMNESKLRFNNRLYKVKTLTVMGIFVGEKTPTKALA